MSSKTIFWLFLICFTIAAILALLVHVVELEALLSDESLLYVVETIMYLTGLAALYLGWRLIDYKIPSKRDRS